LQPDLHNSSDAEGHRLAYHETGRRRRGHGRDRGRRIRQRRDLAAWWRFAEGKANGFAFVALPVAVIAGREAGNFAGSTPAWAARTALVAGIASFTGWALGMWFEVAIGSFLWVVASIVMSLWTLWFGVVLMRTPSAGPGQPPR
jgi:hypothetical protein